jgi:predicted acylesterase/phospholipase RssA
MTIKHLVLSGGGPIMIQLLGALQHLESTNFIDLKNIESIYGTSAGAIVGILICLKHEYDWETINDYIIKRPWKDVFKIKVEKILESYSKKGIFDIKTIEKCFKPLFAAKDIPMNITLENFYKYSNIELHMFAFEVNEFKIEDISYLTHPKLELFTAIQMTCCLPVLLAPVCLDDKYFIDGGIVCNYPLNYCINSGKNEDEILGFKNKYDEDKKNHINSDSTLLDFLMCFFFKILYSLNTENLQKIIKNEFICKADKMSVEIMKNSLYNIDVRKTLFDNGIEDAKEFLSKLNNNDNLEETVKVNDDVNLEDGI